MMGQTPGLARVADGLVECLQGHSGHRLCDGPADNPARVDVSHERRVEESLARFDVGVGSAALSVFELVGLCWPLCEPDVPIPEHPALHLVHAKVLVHGVGIRVPRYW
jgi:hypothetical protein